MVTIKSKPEHFIVKENNTLQFDESGQYSYYCLWKKNYNTQDALKQIALTWNIKQKFINAAGNKDRNAITEQYISINRGPKKDLELKDLKLTYLGKGKERLNLGSLESNSFEIVVEDVEKAPRELGVVINYFDNQRFGRDKNNHIVGQLLIERKFKQACEELDLTVTNNDFVGALRKTPKHILRLYIHAYQAYLWNENVREYISMTHHFDVDYALGTLCFPLESIQNQEFYLYGFENGHREFIMREIPELTESGGERPLISEVKEFSCEKVNDSTYKVSFTLNKGSYATVVIKYLFG